jgi:nicotinate-nucleotide adenylyltransferase
MRIGLYGGTFDPIHLGHLLLARDALEQLGLDRMRFLPANHSPHKPEIRITPGPIRLEMVRAAIAGEPRFEADDRELRRPPPSYTIDTVRELIAEIPGAEFTYLIGADNLPLLHTWREIGALRGLVRFAVLARAGAIDPAGEGMPVIRREIEISSTEIRNRIANGQPVRYLVPDAVETIIRRHHLYPKQPSPPSR